MKNNVLLDVALIVLIMTISVTFGIVGVLLFFSTWIVGTFAYRKILQDFKTKQ